MEKIEQTTQARHLNYSFNSLVAILNINEPSAFLFTGRNSICFQVLCCFFSWFLLASMQFVLFNLVSYLQINLPTLEIYFIVLKKRE